MLDTHLLTHDTVQSLWHLHSQPPLFNLFCGILLHLPLGVQQPVAAGCFWLLGLLLACSTYLLLVELHVPPWAAAIMSLIVVANPATVLYENRLSWSYPAASLLTVSAYCCARFMKTRHTGWGVACFACFGLVVLDDSTYQWVWLVAVLAVFLLLHEARVAPGPARGSGSPHPRGRLVRGKRGDVRDHDDEQLVRHEPRFHHHRTGAGSATAKAGTRGPLESHRNHGSFWSGWAARLPIRANRGYLASPLGFPAQVRRRDQLQQSGLRGHIKPVFACRPWLHPNGFQVPMPGPWPWAPKCGLFRPTNFRSPPTTMRATMHASLATQVSSTRRILWQAHSSVYAGFQAATRGVAPSVGADPYSTVVE